MLSATYNPKTVLKTKIAIANVKKIYTTTSLGMIDILFIAIIIIIQE